MAGDPALPEIPLTAGLEAAYSRRCVGHDGHWGSQERSLDPSVFAETKADGPAFRPDFGRCLHRAHYLSERHKS